jgi:hypothetical protein
LRTPPPLPRGARTRKGVPSAAPQASPPTNLVIPSPAAAIAIFQLLSFRAQPERERRRSRGTCCLPTPPLLPRRARTKARRSNLVIPSAAGARATAKSRNLLFAYTTTPPAESTNESAPLKPCHSERSRSASDGEVEEPAVCLHHHPSSVESELKRHISRRGSSHRGTPSPLSSLYNVGQGFALQAEVART